MHCSTIAIPELVPMLNWLELRINVFGSEQKSLRAWQQQEKERDKAKGKVSRGPDRLTYLCILISASTHY